MLYFILLLSLFLTPHAVAAPPNIPPPEWVARLLARAEASRDGCPQLSDDDDSNNNNNKMGGILASTVSVSPPQTIGPGTTITITTTLVPTLLGSSSTAPSTATSVAIPTRPDPRIKCPDYIKKCDCTLKPDDEKQACYLNPYCEWCRGEHGPDKAFQAKT